MTDAASLTQRLQDLIVFIDEANASMDRDAVPTLNNLDQKVAKLCMDVEQSPPVIAKQIQPLMAQMITKLDELALKLQDFQTRTKSETKD